MVDLSFNPKHLMLSAERSCQEFVNFIKKGVLETTGNIKVAQEILGHSHLEHDSRGLLPWHS
jgi:hypothetical protein